MKISSARLHLLSAFIVLQLSGVEAGADIVGSWNKMNSSPHVQPAVAHRNHPSLTCPAMWKTNFYTYNDNRWFYIDPWTTNNFAQDVSATTYNNAGMPITNYTTFVFAISNGFKLALTNFITRVRNDEHTPSFQSSPPIVYICLL